MKSITSFINVIYSYNIIKGQSVRFGIDHKKFEYKRKRFCLLVCTVFTRNFEAAQIGSEKKLLNSLLIKVLEHLIPCNCIAVQCVCVLCSRVSLLNSQSVSQLLFNTMSNQEHIQLNEINIDQANSKQALLKEDQPPDQEEQELISPPSSSGLVEYVN